MPCDLDAAIARERELMDCINDARDQEREQGEAAWRTRQIDKMTALLDEIRAENEVSQ